MSNRAPTYLAAIAPIGERLLISGLRRIRARDGRHAVLAVLSAAYLVCYLDRMAMASAIPFIAREFQLSPLAVGAVLSAFFAGYSLMQIPGGLLVDRFGPHRVMTFSILCWSLFTALTGAAGSLAGLLLLRVLFGLSEGPFPPAASKALAIWFPQKDMGRANGTQLAAVQIGAALAPLVVTALLIHWGWRSVFYSLLVPGLILTVAAQWLVKDAPEQDPSAAREEAIVSDRLPVGNSRVGLRDLMTMPAVVWCCVTSFLVSLSIWSLTNWLPTYLLQARGLEVQKMGLFASLPFLAGAVGYYAGGYLSDRCFRHRRHIPIVVGLMLSAGMIYLAAVSATGEWAVACLVPAFLFLFVASAGVMTMPLLVVPQQVVGAAFGIVNTATQLAAFLSPLLIGYVLQITHNNFTWVFYGVAAVFLAAAGSGSQIRHRVVQVSTIASRAKTNG